MGKVYVVGANISYRDIVFKKLILFMLKRYSDKQNEIIILPSPVGKVAALGADG